MKSLQGHFLVAAPHEIDPNFVEAIILVVEHADRGAFCVTCQRLRSSVGLAARRPEGPAGMTARRNLGAWRVKRRPRGTFCSRPQAPPVFEASLRSAADCLFQYSTSRLFSRPPV